MRIEFRRNNDVEDRDAQADRFVDNQVVPVDTLTRAATELSIYPELFRIYLPGHREVWILQRWFVGRKAHFSLPPIKPWWV
jgi:hypothetical protein